MKKLFQGEMMECANCGTKLKSNPQVNSNWTAIEIDGKVIYVCPDCFDGRKPINRARMDKAFGEE